MEGKELYSAIEWDKYTEGSQEGLEKCLAKEVSDQTLKDVQEWARQREWLGQRPKAEGSGMFEASRGPVWLQWGDWGTLVRDGVRNVTGPHAAGNDSLCLYPGTNESHWGRLGRAVTWLILVLKGSLRDCVKKKKKTSRDNSDSRETRWKAKH